MVEGGWGREFVGKGVGRAGEPEPGEVSDATEEAELLRRDAAGGQSEVVVGRLGRSWGLRAGGDEGAERRSARRFPGTGDRGTGRA
jgi:hypothetical protein